jgi:glucokinase
MINLISPEKVIISGGISNAPDHLLLDPIKEFVYNQAYLSIVDKLTIQSSFLGDNAPIIGASMLFKH